MSRSLLTALPAQLQSLREQGLYKSERIIQSPQSASVGLSQGSVINLCANNYLGLADDKRLIDAAKTGLDDYGYGAASVRFICGTLQVHKDLEARISDFLGMEDTILYSSCFDANTGLFETLLDGDDAIISDALNHASIIDGVRLCKAQRYRYANNDMAELERCLQQSQDARYRLIVTDGVFSMDGVIANLPAICDLAEKYDALVMVDDSHAVGFMGEGGRGTPEYHGVMDRVDIITGTLGKALGGASGGYTSAAKPIVDWLRQRSRPYLFSNSLAPSIAAASLQALDLIAEGNALRQQLWDNTTYFRDCLSQAGFTLSGGDHPIIPVMVGDAALAGRMAELLLERGIYVVGFSYPVVPQGQARIRTQMSAGLNREQLEQAVLAFIEVGRELEIIA
ncbi:glycine C-acetyltransferase [Saccharospirillum sp. MSK14-1]|uniref:glycine C-acetyltransferase n=1 Tax=Saccharospirillum sp. MSK14-1 TaxID=1897632 RepID=UPI000D3CBA75|nr:glycine C-acetyltransferase [Saccharospirillum sp. MSK14-1]PTY35947.1 glycine C-acetyltransferase [Saccharospirillum sp. MSK14-1]